MIALIKYRAGNIASVSNALERLGVDFYLAETTEQLDKADGIIFPGVGHAYSAMESLKENGIDAWLKSTKNPFWVFVWECNCYSNPLLKVILKDSE